MNEDRMSLDEMIEVIQAVKDGKEIQSKSRGSDHWRDNPLFRVFTPNFIDWDYRVKPPKKEVWIIYRDHTRVGTFNTESEAWGAKLRYLDNSHTIVHMVEKGAGDE